MNTPRPIPSLDEIARCPELVTEVPAEAIPDIVGELEELKTRLLQRLFISSSMERRADEVEADRLLTAEEAASVLGTTKYYLYRHGKDLPFTVKLSPRQLRFSAKGIEKYKRQRQLG